MSSNQETEGGKGMEGRKRQAIGAAVMVCLGIWTGAAKGKVLSGEEVLACEELNTKLEWLNEAIQEGPADEVDMYNQMVTRYNANCGPGRRYYEDDMESAKRSVIQRQRELEKEARRMLESHRREKEARLAYVTEEQGTEVRQKPQISGRRIRTAARWETVEKTGDEKDGWIKIQWKDIGEKLWYGWIANQDLADGSGIEPRAKECEATAGRRPIHGEEIGGARRGGRGKLVIDNRYGTNAYVKVRSSKGEKIRSVYVAGKRQATVEDIPPGAHILAYATGEKMSRGCDSFVRIKSAGRFEERLDYSGSGTRWTITLYHTPSGNARTRSMTAQQFAAF